MIWYEGEASAAGATEICPVCDLMTGEVASAPAEIYPVLVSLDVAW